MEIATMNVEQFTCYDAPTRAQVVTIQWERLEARDDCNDKPDDRDEGFWPSTDPKAAGYVGPENVERFEELYAAAMERMTAWNEGDWYYIGIVARAHVSIPIGGGSFRTLTLDSAGCWGIESDAGDYLDEVFEEEKAELLRQLAVLGKWAMEQTK
jgi:hypothetical protein